MESLDMIRQGRTQSESMPLAESIYMMKFMDDIRKEWAGALKRL